MKKIACYLLLISITATTSAQKDASISFEKWISLRSAGNALISPDGKTVVYTVTSTDWASNGYDSELWMVRQDEKPFQLTRTFKGNSSGASFTPDSRWVSFIADRGEKSQIYLMAVAGGEAFPITKEEEGINGFQWSPDGSLIAFTQADTESKKSKGSKERYGGFGIEGEEFRLSHLWIQKFDLDSILLAGSLPCYNSKTDSTSKTNASVCFTIPKPYKLTDGNFSVGGFQWSPDGKSIGFSRQPNPLINTVLRSEIAIADLATKKVTTIVNNPSTDAFISFSPDSRQILYGSSVDDTTTFFFRNARLFIHDLASGKSREIAATFDENKNVMDWNPKGIFFNASQKTRSGIFIIDPTNGNVRPYETGLDLPGFGSFSKDGNSIALSGRNFNQLGEIYIARNGEKPKQVTDLSAQIKNWNTPINEVIEWKSKDGTPIEGVLLKPANFDPKKKYPLLVVIHGGPTGIDRPEPTPTYVYPVMQWCEKGALVLRVNYRGSAGYGAKFRALNVRNLGVGDMWDVVSGVEHLSKQGLIDTSRMGCMGWSQGGYISAFLTTNTTIFKAISVGAGISNWMTYYVNTDITPFTRQYLGSTPWSDPSIYAKTSPMTNINKAKTPTLIQHGEFDKRVPIPNAYELYRGLQDRGIPSKLIIYKGFGHGINKPKERLAAVWHNWQWFNEYIFGDKMEDLPAE